MALGFVMVSFQKLLSSSSHALDRALERRWSGCPPGGRAAAPQTLTPISSDDDEEDEAG